MAADVKQSATAAAVVPRAGNMTCTAAAIPTVADQAGGRKRHHDDDDDSESLQRGNRPSSRTRSALGETIRQRDTRAEAEAYLPRQGCHRSLPPGKVACRVHEELRLSGTIPYDTGPAHSD